ncbi:FAD-binding oxidoreductase [Paraconexibacter sp.]|uniref:FAD-binding oxidoreductase n=1 Tax=Paraconexibacter sp. TaxID=2949640 RepID=UPI0035652167
MTPQTTPFASELALPDGSVHRPGEPEYEDACGLFNAMIVRRPRLVARCTSAADVQAALAFARANGLDFTVRAGGHSVSGLALCDDGVVADVRGIDFIEVDPERQIARVGGGVIWADLDRATAAHGLATTGGRVSSTGVAGLTLGGGSGWLERKHGLTTDNLIAAELVTADGRVVRASADENAELFWALRGGGGNFGVVVAFEFALHRLEREVLAGLVIHPGDRTAELLALWRDVMRDAPEGLSLAFISLTAPAEPEIPEHLHGTTVAAIAGMYAGPVEEGEQALRSVREFGDGVDLFEPMAYEDFQCSLDDPPGYRNWWTAEYLREMPDATVERIAARCEAKPTGPAQLFCVAWGGAVSRGSSEQGPLRGRDARYIVHPLVLWEDASDDQEMIAWGRGFREDVAGLGAEGTYLNFVGADEGQARVVASYGRQSYERLRRIKAQWDPQDVFRGSGHVPPARGAGG